MPFAPQGYDADPLAITTVSLEPPLPVYLFNVVAGLRDKSAKGYPVKKVRFFSQLVMLSDESHGPRPSSC